MTMTTGPTQPPSIPTQFPPVRTQRPSTNTVELVLLRVGFFVLILLCSRSVFLLHGYTYSFHNDIVDFLPQPEPNLQEAPRNSRNELVNLDNNNLDGTAIVDDISRPKNAVRSTKTDNQPPPRDAPNSKSAGEHLRIAMVTFSHLKSPDRFENLLFPSLETWMTTGTYFVVLTNQWRDAYQKLCDSRRLSNATSDCSRMEAIFVDCPEGAFGESPCCKQEKGLTSLSPDDWDWIVFFDDDMYFRMEAVERYLRNFDPLQLLLATPAGKSAKELGMFGYLGRRQSPYLCSTDQAYRYPWGQPVIYSQAAFRMLLPGFRAGGLVRQCLEFNVTHDAGNPIVHWMYQIPDVTFKFHMFADHKISREALAIHGITRYRAAFNRSYSMHDIHGYVQEQKRVTIKKYMLQVHDERHGFNQTETYAKYGHPSTWGDQWHTMPVSDCLSPGDREQQGPK